MPFSAEEIEEFKAEANELLDSSEKNLMELDQGGDFKNCFDSTFRSLHNLKGGAGMMELEDLQKHTHEIETIFMSFKNKSEIPKDYITFFLSGIDAARSILNGQSVEFDYQVKEQKNVVPDLQIISMENDLDDTSRDEFFSECEETVNRISKQLNKIEKGEYSQDTIDDLYREVHSMKGGAYLFSYNKLGDIAHSMESSLEKIRNGSHTPNKLLLDCLFKSLEVIEAIIKNLKLHKSDDSFSAIVPVIAKTLNHISSQLPETIKMEVIQKEVEKHIVKEVIKEKETEVSSSIRVPVSLLDSLMTLMGEMVLVRNQVLQYSNKTEDLEFLSMSKRLNVVTSEIQEEMMKTRMQPISNVLDKFQRVVRDLSQELHKKIDIEILGADTELDKSILESIKDPLTHIVRNSCDHGIELPDVRLKNGKAEHGLIKIKAYHEGGQVVIEVKDDGRGLNRDQIKNKAVEKGIITLTQSQTLSDKAVCDLIFAPGFSTASQVTNVSGRGVGMDVVKTNIEKIGGTVELGGVFNQGTSIKIKIPLTLAIIPALIVKCATESFAIPQIKLDELVRVDPDQGNQIEFLHGTPVYRLRGSILPLVDLGGMLRLNENQKEELKNRVVNIAVLNNENYPFGVIIDEIIDTADIVVKPLNRVLKSLNIYSGATVLGDGSIALIFDVTGLSKKAQIQERKAPVDLEKDKKVENDYGDFLVLGLNSQTKHALALNYVQRLEVFSSSQIEYSGKSQVIRYRNEMLTLISLNNELGYEIRPYDEFISVVVIERAGRLFGLVVNSILDTLTTRADVHEPVKKQTGVFGNLFTDNELIVIIDPFEIISNLYDAAEVASSRSVAVHEGGRILLVEDTVYFRKAMKNALEKKGYEVVTADDGKEAFELLLSHKYDFDVVVSDIEMPRMNGFELAKNIRGMDAFSHLPLLAVSSKADSHYREEGRKAGFNVYLEKLRTDLLLSNISELKAKYRNAA